MPALLPGGAPAASPRSELSSRPVGMDRPTVAGPAPSTMGAEARFRRPELRLNAHRSASGRGDGAWERAGGVGGRAGRPARWGQTDDARCPRTAEEAAMRM